MRILVVDEKTERITLADDLAAQGHDAVTAVDGEDALAKLGKEHFDIVVTGLKMPKLDGMELLKRIKQGPLADIPVIMVTAHGTISTAVKAMKLGAFDFIPKPFRNEDLLPLIARIESPKTALRGTASSADDWGRIEESIVGRSAAIWRVRRLVEICSRTDANVLLCGETGVGKDLVASVIHQVSDRRHSPWVKVGCSLFPSPLMESELYGHEKGAFTSADQPRKGRLDMAQGGTLYLDDVDDIPLDQQAKLLRVIEEKVYERVGGATPIRADVRIIASTKQNLLDKIAEGSFRQDLYYRLDVLRINLPPLRERREDLPELAQHLVERIARDRPCEIDPEAVEVLARHDWPGNVRELYHTLQRACLVGTGRIRPEFLLADVVSRIAPRPQPGSESFRTIIEETERELLEDALKACGGNKKAAAEKLRLKLSTFRDKLAKYGLG